MPSSQLFFQEWQNILFECNPYRESGVSILSGVEDVQVSDPTKSYKYWFANMRNYKYL
jgi:hypothetical protein